ncbi:hypothetical protein BsWGS_07921 [Bradybaena similaris]
MAEIRLAVKYNEELVKDIQEVFTHLIVPDNFILVIHKYNKNVLTFADIERIRKRIRCDSTMEVNYDLLLTMKNYNGWFEAILQVCNDPNVKQADLADAFRTIKVELDERWTKENTKSKEIATTPANVSLTSKSKLGATTSDHQLSANGGFEADSGAACMSSDTTDQPSWKGFQLKNGKPYCDVCCLELTSPKAANDHFKGKPHQKELKRRFPVSEDVSKTGKTTATIESDGAKSTPSSESNSGSNEPAAMSPGPTSDNKMTPESLKSVSCNDEGIAKELLTESQSVIANCAYWGGLKIKNENQYCDICDTILTSKVVADDHCKGKTHKKNLKKAFPASQGAPESGITAMSGFQASSGNINAMAGSCNQSVSCETFVVSSTSVSVCKLTAPGVKLTSCNDKEISASSGSKESKPTNSGVTEATPGSACPGVFEATSQNSDAAKATLASSSAAKPTVVSPAATEATVVSPATTEATVVSPTTTEATVVIPAATEATVVSHGSQYVFALASKKASGFDEEYIIENDKGQLECRICKVLVSGAENAIQHLEGSKHKKALKALDDRNEVPPELGPQGETLIMHESGAGKCFVCNISINSRDSARQHVEGRQHINRCKRYNLSVK